MLSRLRGLLLLADYKELIRLSDFKKSQVFSIKGALITFEGLPDDEHLDV